MSLIWNFEQKSEAWHEARCGRVTGTRFKALMAAESTQTYKDLVTELACEIVSKRQEESYISADMERGVLLEPIARNLYSSIFEVEVREVGFITPDENNPFYEWVGISPDGYLPDGGLLEIKCPKYKTHFSYITDDKLPYEYRHQVQGQLYVSEAPYCDFISYAENMKPFIIRVFPDLELHKEYTLRLTKLITEVKDKLKIYNNYDYLIK